MKRLVLIVVAGITVVMRRCGGLAVAAASHSGTRPGPRPAVGRSGPRRGPLS
jgi:hypothetical protein